MTIKRLFDIFVSTLGLIIMSPVFLAVAVIVKLESRGPVFYRCQRVGLGGRMFGMFKFRTMIENADAVDCKLCTGSDVRVTSFGRFLRRTKLNELPQLFDVIRGRMSVVGPRPEDPKFVDLQDETWKEVLSVRPGIFGPNQILNRNEEDMLPCGMDAEKFYAERILPEKLQVDVDYVRNQTVGADLLIVWKGIFVTVFKGMHFRNFYALRGIFKFAVLDGASSILAYLLANLMRYETIPTSELILFSAIFVGFLNPLVFLVGGLYKRSVRFFSFPDLFHLMKLAVVSTALLVGFNYFLFINLGHSRAVYFLYFLTLVPLIGSMRVLTRIVLERRELSDRESHSDVKAVIYGAGRLGAETVRRLRFEKGVTVVGFVDDDPELKGRSVLGVEVLGTSHDLSFLKSLHKLERVYMAFKPTSHDVLARARRECARAGIPHVVKVPTDLNPQVGPMLYGSNPQEMDFVKELNIGSVRLNLNGLEKTIDGSTIAIVGPGDHLGAALCLELLKLNVKHLVLIEDCENRLNRICYLLKSLNVSRSAFSPYSVPVDCHYIAKNSLGKQQVDWVIYNGPNRPAAAPDFNQSSLSYSCFSEVALYAELAKSLNAQGFTFLSPCDKDSFSVDEMRWTPLSRQNLNFFKVEKYTSVLGERPRFPALGYGCPSTAGTGFGTQGPGEGVSHCRI